MRRTARPGVFLAAVLGAALVLAGGCATAENKAQLSGKVLFKGKPVPLGYISFTPKQGAVRMVQIKDGVYDTALEGDGGGIPPGVHEIVIAGFDGHPEPGFGQGKQIFNAYKFTDTVPEGTSTKDFTVSDSAAENLRIEPTSDR